MSATHDLLMICGSLRAGSTNEALLRTAADVAPDRFNAHFYTGTAALPHFNPDHDVDPLHPAVIELRSMIAAADALLFCTPEYAGGLPGSFKNMLDWTVGGVDIVGKPAAWLNASNAGRGGAAGAHASLRAVLGFTGATLVEDACAHIPVPRSSFGDDGVIRDEELRGQVSNSLGALLDHLTAARDT
jgi:chromate reductase, NAD(P)H dehydrogenase (quinone)